MKALLVPLLVLSSSSFAADHLSVMQMRQGYGMDSIGATGAGQTVAVLLPGWADPDQIVSDMVAGNALANQEANAKGNQTLSDPKVTVYYSGEPPAKSANPKVNFDIEAAIDPQAVHDMAPDANIIVIISKADPDSKVAAMQFAISHGANIVSMSFGAPQSECTPSYVSRLDAIMKAHPTITFIAGSGDSGTNPSSSGGFQTAYPASSPFVLAVGAVNEDFSEHPPAWNKSGGGQSADYNRPQWQLRLGSQGQGRMLPDLALAGGAGVPISTVYGGVNKPMDGTSVSAPLMAGVMAVANQLNKAPLGDIHKFIYVTMYNNSYTTYFRDSQSGNNGYAAADGYDMLTGLGVPRISALMDQLTQHVGVCSINGSDSTTKHGACYKRCVMAGFDAVCTWNGVTLR